MYIYLKVHVLLKYVLPVGSKKFVVRDSGYSEGGDRVSVVTRNGLGP